MKTVILCGGKGTRLREETEYKPKPLVLIGDKPILWHIMKIYSHYGHKDFILCLGYKGEMIKDYFLRLAEMSNDFTLKRDSNDLHSIQHHQNNLEDWNITFVDTGLDNMTGSRVAQIKEYIGDDEDFFLTYGDGVANININSLYNFHKLKGKIATTTIVSPISYYGVVEVEDGLIKSFQEKPRLERRVSGGFFVCNKKIFDYLNSGKNCILENEALKVLAEQKQLSAYEHNGFWFGMDTYKHQERLNKIWETGRAPWKIWQDNNQSEQKKDDLIFNKQDSDFNGDKLLSTPTRFDLPDVPKNSNRFVKRDEPRKKEIGNSNQYWQNKNVFVTGCTGLLGSWMVKYLVDRGARVTGLVRDFVPDSNLYRNDYFSKINAAKGQLEDIYFLERVLGEYEIDTVFHLGAQTIVGIANRNPVSTFESNIRGSYNLLEACRRSPLIKRIVVASSDKAYGDQKDLPYAETMPLQGRHPYDVSKTCVDLLSQAYFKTYNLPVCVTRCGNFFGGGDLNFNRIVPDTIRAILQNRAPIIRSDGTLIRDYFYIEDAVEAYLLLAEKMERINIYGQAFNFSNENQITVLELVKKIINLMGGGLEPKILNQAPNEIKHQYLSARKSRELLGWSPKYSFEEGLEKTIDWYKNFFENYANK
ncbi:MAG: hypothetical protein Athens101410_183 [Parcubacteria group bacterium Athens1014_10]|nr:MAG: hypothetical protein Athens101410_183 [Parcubacteria group bacterium Athens1014_10]TSD05547.1 MAG: hypothetical protein Athens071412_248 [Parcubacteria group bacterium Athens0714_12]